MKNPLEKHGVTEQHIQKKFKEWMDFLKQEAAITPAELQLQKLFERKNAENFLKALAVMGGVAMSELDSCMVDPETSAKDLQATRRVIRFFVNLYEANDAMNKNPSLKKELIDQAKKIVEERQNPSNN